MAERHPEDAWIRRAQEWRDVAVKLAEALRFHEDRRINPTSRGGPALAAYDALIDGSMRATTKEGNAEPKT